MNDEELTKVYETVQGALDEDTLDELGRAAGFMTRRRAAEAPSA